jgi:hypothetical protein
MAIGQQLAFPLIAIGAKPGMALKYLILSLLKD